MTTTNQKKFLDQTPIQKSLVGGFHRKFIEVLLKAQPRSILELGCGEGYLLDQVHQQLPNIRLLGLDNYQPSLEEGKRIFPQLDLQWGDIYRIQQADHSWDVAIASEVLEHLDRPDIALRELKRVAGRYVLLSVPHEPWFRLGNLARGRHLLRLGNHPEHVNVWTRGAFVNLVSQHLTIQSVTTAFPWTIVLARV